MKYNKEGILKIETILYIAAEAGADVAVVYTPCYYKVFLSVNMLLQCFWVNMLLQGFSVSEYGIVQ